MQRQGGPLLKMDHLDESTLRAILSASPLAVALVRLSDDSYLLVNDAFALDVGLAEADILGRNANVITPWQQPEGRENFIEALRAGRTIDAAEVTMVRPDGTTCTGRAWANPITVNGEAVACVFMEDVTGQRAQEDPLRSIVENIHAVIYIWEEESDSGTGPMRLIGQESERLLGFTSEEWGARQGVWLRQLHPQDHDRAVAEWEEAVRTGTTFESEYRLLTKDGNVVWVRDQAHVVDVNTNGSQTWHGFMVDITDRRSAEEERLAAAEQLSGLYEVSRSLLESHSLEETAHMALERAASATGAISAGVLLLDKDATSFSILAVHNNLANIPLDEPQLIPVDLKALDDDVMVLDDILVVPGPGNPALDAMMAVGTRSVALLTLTTEEGPLGFLMMAHDDPGYFTKSRAALARGIADQFALALHQVQLRERLDLYAAELETTVTALRDIDGQRKRLLSELVHAQEEERRRVAEEIHDDSVQNLVATHLRLDALRNGVTEPEMKAALDQMAETLRQSIRRLRHQMFAMYPHTLEAYGLAAAVETDLGYLQETRGIAYELENTLCSEASLETRSIAFRIAQEALRNVVKHAEARCVKVSFAAEGTGIRMSISDDGVGFEKSCLPETGHLGLSMMRDRAEISGGSLSIRSQPGAGTTLDVWLPAGNAEAAET